MRILIVEDEYRIAQALKEGLKQESMQSMYAMTVKTAITQQILKNMT